MRLACGAKAAAGGFTRGASLLKAADRPRAFQAVAGQAAPRPSGVKLLHTVEASAPGSGASLNSRPTTHLTH